MMKKAERTTKPVIPLSGEELSKFFNGPNKGNKSKIMEEINREFPRWAPVEENYRRALMRFLNWAGERFDHESRKSFDEHYLNHVREIDQPYNQHRAEEGLPPADFWATYYTLWMEGLCDLVYLDETAALVESGRIARSKGGIYGTRFEEMTFKRMQDYSLRAKYDFPVFILGERGTSKERLAHAIHRLSERSGEFITVDCTGIPDTLLESELFGYEKGAFTGATTLKRGLFELANNGTLFLDELGKMPQNLQGKLLRAVEYGQVLRLGRTKPINVDVRLVVATQPGQVENIIPDLRDRLDCFSPLRLPTLNERLNEIPGNIGHRLIRFSLNQARAKLTRQGGKGAAINAIKISDAACGRLMRREYGGNYRELEKLLTRAVIRVEYEGRDTIMPEDLELPEDEPVTIPVEDSAPTFPLKDIKEYAQTEAARWKREFIRARVRQAKREYGDLKKALEAEGAGDSYKDVHTYINRAGVKVRRL